MTFSDFLLKIFSMQDNIIKFTKLVFNNLTQNYIFKIIICLILFSLIIYVVFWLYELLIKIISMNFYNEVVDRVRNEKQEKFFNKFKSNTPDWLNKDIKGTKATPKEQAEMRKLLKDYI